MALASMAGAKGQFMLGNMSYTAANRKIQWPSGTIIGGSLLLALGLSACSGVSVPLGSDDVETPLLITGSIESDSDVAYADIDKRDREIISLTLDSATIDPADAVTPGETLVWTNPESGNSGTISDVNTASLAENGCLDFSTTANTIAGIKIYRGTACRDISKRLVVTALAALNA